MAINADTISDFLSKLPGKLADLRKECFGDQPAPAAKQAKIKTGFAEAGLPDGSILTWESDGPAPMPNEPVMVMLPDGSSVPAPSGTYILEDETTIVVENGVATAVTPKLQDQAPTPPAPPVPPAETPVSEKQAKAIVESHVKETRFEIEEALKKQLEEIQATYAEKFSALEKLAGQAQAKAEAAENRAAAAEKKAADSESRVQKFSGETIKLIAEMSEQPPTPAPPTPPAPAKSLAEKVEEQRRKTFGRG